jgi:uncharacterized Zn finger protein
MISVLRCGSFGKRSIKSGGMANNNTVIVTAACSNCGQVSETRVVDEITKIEEERIKCHRCGNWSARVTYRNEEGSHDEEDG